MSTEKEIRQDRRNMRRALERCQRQLEEKEKTIAQMRSALEASVDLAEKQAEYIGSLSREVAQLVREQKK
jgi:hypothetical protein